MTSNIFIVVFICYILLLFVLSFIVRAQANKDMEQFGKAGSRFGFIVITVVSIGSWVGSGGLVGLTNSGYAAGVGQWWSYSFIFIAMLPWMFLYIKRIRILKLNSIPDFYALRYPKYNGAVKYPTAILLLIRNATILSMQLNAMALLFSVFLGWSHFFGVCISAVIVMVYVSISGFLSVMVTNTFQSVLQTIAPFAVVIFVLILAGGWGNVHDYYMEMNSLESLSLVNGVNWYEDVWYYFVTTGFFFIFICDQGDWQRVNAAKDWKTARNGFIVGLVLVLPMLMIPSFTGAAARLVLPEGTNPDYVFYELIRMAPIPLAILILCCLMATILSCVSSYLFAGATNIANDIIFDIVEKQKKTTLSDKAKIFYTRMGVVICALLSIFVCFWIEGILEVMYFGLTIVCGGMLCPYLFAWHSKKMNTEGAIAGLIAGGLLAFIWKIAGDPFGIDAVWVSVPVSFFACIIGRALSSPPGDEVYNTFYNAEKFKTNNVDEE